MDNSDSDWKVRQYLREWADIAARIDIATGYFEIGALLALDGQWQKLDELRVLMGDEVSKRTKQAMLAGVNAALQRLDASIEEEKKTNDFLTGIDGIVEGLSGKSPKIRCRVYNKEKFHAKAYISHARSAVIGSAALVGSSNFTYPGLTDNVELNVQIKGREVELLQEWYERYWDKAVDITGEVLKVVERHTREYPPFDVYAKALHEYYRGRELDADAWETTEGPRSSRLYKKLDAYQQDGYHNLLRIADRYGGAFLCDGVGLGKTFVGLMLLERLIIHDRKNVLLLVPKAAVESVWKPAIAAYLPHLERGAFSQLQILSHTDLLLDKCQEAVDAVRDRAHAVIIDEAHHFRNPGRVGGPLEAIAQQVATDVPAGGKFIGKEDTAPSRYRVLFDIAAGKKLFMLTATPINNKLTDLKHMIELFSRRNEEHFSGTLGISNLRSHFLQLEKRLDALLLKHHGGDASVAIDSEQAKEVLAHDDLFKKLVVQRSRAYVRASQELAGIKATAFPTRLAPEVAAYSVKKTYGKLLDMVDTAFKKNKPLFSLAVYNPLAYAKKPDTEEAEFKIEANRQKQIVGLVRTSFLKRFESSITAFERSCERLLEKLLAFVEKNADTRTEIRQFEQWKTRNAELFGYVREHQKMLWGDDDGDDAADDLIDPELLEATEKHDRAKFDVPAMLGETMQDLDTLIEFLEETRKFKPKDDAKLAALKKLLKTDPVLKQHKVLIFTEFADTAAYLRRHLTDEFDGVHMVDGSTSGRERAIVIRRFAPYYNGTTPAELEKKALPEIRILISTDVLSEGLNLQDATRLINFDLHWNPVRLMQRIGRVDRRMNPDIEATINRDHPDRAEIRGTVKFWNFLPPDELNLLLTLYSKVAHKTLRISKTLGIEGKKLLRDDDDYQDLQEFNHAYEGEKSAAENMRLEYEKLLKDYPGLEERLGKLPGRVFSGKDQLGGQAKGVFFCYALPGRTQSVTPGMGTGVFAESAAAGQAAEEWSIEHGETRWYFCPLVAATGGEAAGEGSITTEPAKIVEMIRCTPDTPRHTKQGRDSLSEIRAAVEKHIKNTYLRQLQAPVNAPKPVLKCWMELT